MRSPPAPPAWEIRQGRALWILAASAAVILVVFYAFPGFRSGSWLLVAVWTTAAIGWGARLYRPPHRQAWYLLAGAAAAFLGSNVSDFAYHPAGLPHFADWIGFVGYPSAAAGLLVMVRHRLVGKDVAGLLDALIGVASVTFVAWVYLIAPYVHHSGETWDYRVVAIMDPVGDLVLLGILARLLSSTAARTTSLWLLAAGMAAQTLSDTLESLWRLRTNSWFGTATGNSLLEAGWLVFALCWAAAALVPSMQDATKPVHAPSVGVPPARIAALAVALLITPAVVTVQLIRDDDTTGWFGPVLGAAVSLMILARVSIVLAEHRRALGREQILLAATGSLVGAAGADEVAAALAAAATRLLGRRAPHEVVVAAEFGADVQVTAVGVRPEGPGPPDADAWRAALDRLGSGAADAEWRSAVESPVHPVRVADLTPTLAGQLGSFQHALTFPLGAESRPEAPWTAGVMAIAAEEEELVVLSGSLELLARQAALTLHRIALGQEIARRDGEAYFRALVQNTNDAILIVDAGQRVRYASPSASSLFDRPALLGRPLPELIGSVYAGEVESWSADPTPLGPVRRDWELATPSGIPHEVEATVADLRDEPTVGGFVISLHDVTTARGLERTLQRHAYHDPLTSLPNRLAFSRGLDDALELSSPETSVTVVLMDLDNFREINDFHGREAGDEVLRATAGLLRARLLPGDVLARTGGDEFAVLQVRYAADTPELPLGMPGELAPYFVGPIAVTTSGAVATGSPGSTGAALLADVEMTLHAAKSAAGSRRWRRYDPELRAELAQAAARRSGLDQALVDESFELVYQPIVSLATGDVAGFESLVRWPQPDGSLLPPDEFIPMAEATGQILPLGRWIMRTATEQAAVWNRTRRERGAPPVKVAVNVSAHELRDPLFPASVFEALAAAGLPPELLLLEATETTLIHHAGAALGNLRILARDDIGVALDDFGTGYSSLSYLRDLPVTVLKIDKLFVDGIPGTRRETALVRGIIGIAKSLDLRVVAEGIETGEQCAALTAMGAEFGQGYVFARPMAAAEAASLMAAGVVDLLPAKAAGHV